MRSETIIFENVVSVKHMEHLSNSQGAVFIIQTQGPVQHLKDNQRFFLTTTETLEATKANSQLLLDLQRKLLKCEKTLEEIKRKAPLLKKKPRNGGAVK